MSPENERHLRAKHPSLFGSQPGHTKSAFAERGIEVGDGWLTILDDMATEIEQSCLLADRPLPQILQVKEKIGGLRVYVDASDEAIDAAIAAAEKRATLTCETCGEPGQLQKLADVRTLCSKHAQYSDRP
jgi:hypothetical protein